MLNIYLIKSGPALVHDISGSGYMYKLCSFLENITQIDIKINVYYSNQSLALHQH